MRLLGDAIPLRENLSRSLDRDPVWWVLLVVTAAADFLSTTAFMHESGIHHEQNAIVRYLAYTVGIVPGAALGKLLQLIAAMGLCALSFRLSRLVLVCLVLLNTWAVLINLL